MAIILGPNYETFMQLELDRLRDSRSRSRIVIFFGSLVMGVLITTTIVQIIANSNPWYVVSTPMASMLMMIIPLRLGIRQYFGKTWPNFNFYRMGWVFNNPTFIGVECNELGDRERITEWIRDYVKPTDIFEPRISGSLVSQHRLFLFRRQKDAMLFKLSI